MKAFNFSSTTHGRCGRQKDIRTYNPSTNEPIAELASASSGDVNKAVSAAKKAFKAGRISAVMPGRDYMMKAAEVMLGRLPELAKWSPGHGKPITRPSPSTSLCHPRNGILRPPAGRSRGRSSRFPTSRPFDWVTYEPYGVVGQSALELPCT